MLYIGSSANGTPKCRHFCKLAYFFWSLSKQAPFDSATHVELKTEQMTLTLLCTSYIFHTICSALCTIITVFSFD